MIACCIIVWLKLERRSRVRIFALCACVSVALHWRVAFNYVFAMKCAASAARPAPTLFVHLLMMMTLPTVAGRRRCTAHGTSCLHLLFDKIASFVTLLQHACLCSHHLLNQRRSASALYATAISTVLFQFPSIELFKVICGHVYANQRLQLENIEDGGRHNYYETLTA